MDHIYFIVNWCISLDAAYFYDLTKLLGNWLADILIKTKRRLFLFKLSILSKNKPFNLRQIKCQLEDLDGNKYCATAVNNRLTIFTCDRPYKLLLSSDQFLNNLSFLLADKNIVGYLLFKFNGNLDLSFDQLHLPLNPLTIKYKLLNLMS